MNMAAEPGSAPRQPPPPSTQFGSNFESSAELPLDWRIELARLSKCLADDDEPAPGNSVSSSVTVKSPRIFSGVIEVAPVPSSPYPTSPSEIWGSRAHSTGATPSPQFTTYTPRTPLWTLCNPGNLCFLNSLLQNVARLAPLMFMLEVSRDSHLSEVDSKSHFASAFNHFCRQVNSEGSNSMRASKTTEAFHRVLPNLIAQYGSGRQRQQDAHEVLLRLLEKLDIEGNGTGLCYFNIFDRRQTQRFGHPLPAICTGLVQQEMTCPACTIKSEKSEAFLCLSIPIPVQTEVSLESMMAAYFSQVQVQYRCSTCDCSTALLQQKVGIWPTVLVVHFLRWRGGSKISTNIKIPQKWSFPSDKTCPNYKLNGYILHHGPQANVGHYTAVVLITTSGCDEYFRVSDDVMDPKPIDKSLYSRQGFPSTTCYLAFYVRT